MRSRSPRTILRRAAPRIAALNWDLPSPERLDAKHLDQPFHVVGQNVEAHFRSDLFEGLVRKCAAPIHDFRVLSTATVHVGVKDGLLLAVVYALPVLRSGPPTDRVSGLIRLPIRRPRRRTRSVDHNG